MALHLAEFICPRPSSPRTNSNYTPELHKLDKSAEALLPSVQTRSLAMGRRTRTMVRLNAQLELFPFSSINYFDIVKDLL